MKPCCIEADTAVTPRSVLRLQRPYERMDPGRRARPPIPLGGPVARISPVTCSVLVSELTSAGQNRR